MLTTSLWANPIEGLLNRIDPNAKDKFHIELRKSKKGKDFFELDQAGDKVVIAGNNYVSIATGLNWYLKYYANVHLSWNHMEANLPTQLPKVTQPERRETSQLQRYYLNYCTFSYSMPFWDWERWEEEIDWMAMHGINLSLAITGTESVWFNVLERLGFNRDEIDAFISGPGYMAWWQMNNLEGWGGPNTDRWYEQQTKLQKQIISRMNSYGIEPVLPGYAGMLPHISGEKLGLDITNPGQWCGFPRPAFLQPTDKAFADIADIYYEEMTKLYGKANYYSIDPFHEGGSVEGVDLKLAGASILDAMKRVNTDAVWVIQAWQANPRPAMIDPIKRGDLLVLDLYSESRPMWGPEWSPWYREKGYGKHNWLFDMLLNFGGRTGMHGKMDAVIDQYYQAKAHKNGKHLQGVGATMEAIENNPVMYELLFELPWRNKSFTKEEWLPEYVKARYGKSDKAALTAWNILSETVYGHSLKSTQEGTVETVFAALPAIDISNVSCCSSTHPFYNTDSLQIAAKELLSVANLYKGNENYIYDVVDVVRQTVANRAYYLQKEVADAYKAKEVEKFKLLSNQFLELLLAQDKLLSTHPNFMLGSWVNQARKIGHTLAEKDQNEWNARTIITVWGNRESAFMLHNYAYKEWSGLLKDVYYPRWRAFFTNKELELTEGVEQPKIDFFEMDERWTRSTNPYPSTPQADPIETAQYVFTKYVLK